MTSSYRSGLVAVVGRPSVGKSTLVNRLVGAKVSITSPRPQTTRHRILGIHTGEAAQVVYVDTPGLNPPVGPPRRLGRYLNRTALASLEGVDAIMLVMTADGWREADEYPLSVVRGRGRAVILAINKIDRLKDKRQLLPLIEASTRKHDFAEIVPVSVLEGTNLETLERTLVRYLPEQPPLYPPERLTDKGARFLAAELVREQIFHLYGQEVPYASAVIVDSFREEHGRLYIAMTIWVEREGQKPILIGKGGERLKLVGMRARRALEQILGVKVHLELYVKHRPGWSNSESALRALGYIEEP